MVYVPAGCGWTVEVSYDATAANWVTIQPLQGTGNGSSTYSLAPNVGSTSRTAGLLVTTTTGSTAFLTITQNPRP